MTLRIGELCAGYGGLAMAVMDVLDAEPVWHAETDPGAAAVLARHWPDVPNLGDITTVDWSRVEPVDVLTSGFPCQPVSNAGLRKGHEDDRWIWPAVARAIRLLRPRLVVLENVAALLVRGFDAVADSLAGLGYGFTWTCLRASDVGAAHQRRRWFCLAWPADAPRPGLETRRQGRPGGNPPADTEGVGQREPADAALAVAGSGSPWPQPRGGGVLAAADSARVGRGEGRPEPARQLRRLDVAERGGATPADADSHGREVVIGSESGVGPRDDTDLRGSVGWGDYAPAIERWEHVTGRPVPAPTEPGARGGQRLSARFTEWLMGLPDGWVTATPGMSRNQALRCLGNGVVPLQGAAAVRMLLERAT